MKPLKAFRSIVAFVFLVGVFGFAITALVSFGIAAFTQSGDALVAGFAYLVLACIAMVFTSLIMPKDKKGGADAVSEPQAKEVHTVRAIMIPSDPDTPIRHATIPDDLDTLKSLVGGYIEAVGGGSDWVAYANEEGKLQELPVNRRATHILAFMGGHNIEDPIVGTVVVTGRKVTGEAGDVPDAVADRILALGADIAS